MWLAHRIPSIWGHHTLNLRMCSTMVRLIDTQGKNCGTVKRQFAEQEAQKQGVHLIEVSPQAKPPVVKLMTELPKIQTKVEPTPPPTQERRRRRTKTDEGMSKRKEVRIGARAENADVQTLISRVHKFLKANHPVKITIKSHYRMEDRIPTIIKQFTRVLDTLTEPIPQNDDANTSLVLFQVQNKARVEGPNVSMLLFPTTTKDALSVLTEGRATQWQGYLGHLKRLQMIEMEQAKAKAEAEEANAVENGQKRHVKRGNRR